MEDDKAAKRELEGAATEKDPKKQAVDHPADATDKSNSASNDKKTSSHITGADSAKICAQCGTRKPLSEYYKKQKNKADGVCKPCWDQMKNKKKKAPTSTSSTTTSRPTTTGAKKKAPTNTSKPTGGAAVTPQPPKLVVCCECKESKAWSDFSKAKQEFYKYNGGGAVCEACIAGRDKKAYFTICGVGYEFPGFGGDDDEESSLPDGEDDAAAAGNKKDEQLESSSSYLLDNKLGSSSTALVGDYEIVYYASLYHDSDDIQRSVRGHLKLRMTEWDYKPALYGEYQLGTYDSKGRLRYEYCDGKESGLGPVTGASFIENVVDWDAEGTFLACSQSGGKDDKKFIVNRDPMGDALFPALSKDGKTVVRKFWDHMPMEEDKVDRMDAYCFATLHKLKRRMVLGLCPDRQNNNSYMPTACPRINLGETEEERLKNADTLMAKYKAASKSWVCRHLENFDARLAMKVREFVTPPPVFYLEKDDLVLKVQETAEPDWEKVIVFRKKIEA